MGINWCIHLWRNTSFCHWDIQFLPKMDEVSCILGVPIPSVGLIWFHSKPTWRWKEQTWWILKDLPADDFWRANNQKVRSKTIAQFLVCRYSRWLCGSINHHWTTIWVGVSTVQPSKREKGNIETAEPSSTFFFAGVSTLNRDNSSWAVYSSHSHWLFDLPFTKAYWLVIRSYKYFGCNPLANQKFLRITLVIQNPNESSVQKDASL